MLRFSKPKGPGFGLSSHFYLSILSSSSVLPSISSLVNPTGKDGAVIGFGVPLGEGKDKELLTLPLSRGAYAVASKDRKTLLRLLVVSKEEAGYDPEAYARSALSVGADPELMARLRGTWTLGQLSFESHDPAVIPAVQLALELSVRFASLAEGVIADPISERYLLPHQVIHPPLGDVPLDIRDLVSVKFDEKDGVLQAFTLGMQKLSLPEFEIQGLDEGSEGLAVRFLLGLCQSVLGHAVPGKVGKGGRLWKPGDRAGDPRDPFQVAEGGLDRGRWEGIACYELLPQTGRTASEALASWAATLV